MMSSAMWSLSSLLVAQRRRRVDRGGAPRGEIPREETDRAEDAGRPGRDRGRQRRASEEREDAIRVVRDETEARHDERRDRHPGDAPDERVKEALEDEWPRDPARPRAERHLDADLARPFLDD